MSDWDPDQYGRFATERAQPFWDLVELVDPTTVGRMVDLGCGDGALSVEAATRLGATDARRRRFVAGDARADGRGRARRTAWTSRSSAVTSPRGRPRASRTVAGISCWPTPACNGCPATRRCCAVGPTRSRPRGQLAVQVPANGTHASHVVANEVGATEPFLDALGGQVPADPSACNVLAPEEYAADPLRPRLRVAAGDVARLPARARLVVGRRRMGARHHPQPVLRTTARRPARALRRRVPHGACSAASATWRRTSTRSSASSSSPAAPDCRRAAPPNHRLRQDFGGQVPRNPDANRGVGSIDRRWRIDRRGRSARCTRCGSGDSPPPTRWPT